MGLPAFEQLFKNMLTTKIFPPKQEATAGAEGGRRRQTAGVAHAGRGPPRVFKQRGSLAVIIHFRCGPRGFKQSVQLGIHHPQSVYGFSGQSKYMLYYSKLCYYHYSLDYIISARIIL